MTSGWDDFVERSVSTLKSKSLLRTLHPVLPSQNAVQVNIRGDILNEWLQECDAVPSFISNQCHPLKLFSLNDYLGLSTHPQVCLAACEAACLGGLGPRSSPLVGGYSTLHRDLETQLACLKGTEEALLFPSGFAANQACIAVLAAGSDCTIFSDELNHASIIDGARLAKQTGATLKVYRHNDMDHLEILLSQASPYKRKLVVTDSLFSMDGDFAKLPDLVRFRQKFGFLLVIDEAHATLVCGESGGGAAEMFNVSEEVDVHVGTLSKAIGSQGGFVACSRGVKKLLLNRGRPYVFSTSLAGPSVAAASAAISVLQQERWRQNHVWNLAKRLEDGLGIKVESPIVPVIIGEERDTLQAAGILLSQGYHVPAIRPPTVKPGTCRLRISLSAAHSIEDVDSLILAIKSCNVPIYRAQKLQKISQLSRI